MKWNLPSTVSSLKGGQAALNPADRVPGQAPLGQYLPPEGVLPFHHGNWNQLGHFPGNACVVNHLNHLTDVLVGIGFFFREP